MIGDLKEPFGLFLCVVLRRDRTRRRARKGRTSGLSSEAERSFVTRHLLSLMPKKAALTAEVPIDSSFLFPASCGEDSGRTLAGETFVD